VLVINDADGTIAVCECRFRDEASIEATFTSAEAPAVLADIPNYTDLVPKTLRAFPL
jgi:hypothetical protein